MMKVWQKKVGSKLVNTFGDEIVSHITAINKEYEDYMAMVDLIQNDLRRTPNWDQQRYMYIHIYPYCKEGVDMLVPAEFCVTVFSFNAGIIDVFTGLMDPADVPFGETGEVTQACEENAVPWPGKFEESVDRITPEQFMARISEMAKKYNLYAGKDILLFAIRAEASFVTGCLKWIQNKTKSELTFNVSRFEVLLMEMSKMLTNPKLKEGVIYQEGGAASFIFRTRYDFMQGLGCSWHTLSQNVGKVDRCAQSIAMRRVYNVLYYLCHLYGKNLNSPSHIPPY